MAHQSFSWDKFFGQIGIDPDNVTSNAWKRAFARNDLGVATKLFNTAYSIAKNVLNDSYAVSWDEINALNLGTGVSSGYFCGNRQLLCSQLDSIGAKLLQHHGDYQYIRTIAFYSGVALVKVIKSIADELQGQRRTLTDYALQYHTPEEVKTELHRYVERHAAVCLNGFSDREEREGARDDIYDTLIHLMDLYRERLTSFSVEDLLDVCCLPVPRPSAQKIAELFGRVSQERIKIGIGRQGEGVFKFPIQTPVLESDNSNGTSYDSLWIKIVRGAGENDNVTWLTYRRGDGGTDWQLDYTGDAQIHDGYAEIPLLDVTKISRIPVLNGEQCSGAAMDIRPRVCDSRYILYVEHAGNEAIYLPGRKVNINDVCHVFHTTSLGELKVAVRDEEGETTEFSKGAISRFVLEGDCLDALLIDGDEYPITSNAENNWLDGDGRFRYLYRAGRRAYPSDVCPVLVETFPAARSIIYRVGDENVTLREKTGEDWSKWFPVPPRMLWKRGTLEVRGDSNVLRSSQIIFVSVDFGDFDGPSQVDEQLDPSTVQYQDDTGNWKTPKIDYTHGDTAIQFAVGDLTVRRPIDRVGVFFITPSGRSISITPESEDWREATPLAENDIYDLTCKVVVPTEGDGDYKVLLVRGGEYVELKQIAQEKIRENGCTTFHWRDYAGKFSERNKDSRYFSICISNDIESDLWIYKFRAINPLELCYEAVGTLPPHAVRHKLRDDGALEACHHIPLSDVSDENDGIPTSFICCPIAKLDDEKGFTELPCQSEFTAVADEGRVKVAQETVIVPNFRTTIGELLNSGCVCFLAKKKRFINADGFEYRLVSSGFFVRDVGTEPVNNGLDIISRLRHALAVKDETEICTLLQSEDEGVRAVVSGALDRVWRNVNNIHAPQVRDYLNLYRCVIRNAQGKLVERSGYAFLADWYDFGQKKQPVHGVDRHLADEYQKYWPRLMFPIQNTSVLQGCTLDEYLRGDIFKLQCRKLSSPILSTSMFLELYDAINAQLAFEGSQKHGHPWEWICKKSIGKCFYGQYYEYCCDNKIYITSGSWDDFKRRVQVIPALARKIMRQKPYLYYGSLSLNDQLRRTPSEILCGLRKREIREFLRYLAKELCEWRKNPSLDERAQKLKKNLLLLERIDGILFSAPPNGDNPRASAPCCFTELVELLAFNQYIHSV